MIAGLLGAPIAAVAMRHASLRRLTHRLGEDLEGADVCVNFVMRLDRTM